MKKHYNVEVSLRRLMVGSISHSELPLFYRAADIFVRTSRLENFGLRAIEAMACGTPVVAPNTATFPEILESTATLYVPGDPVSLAEKVILLLTDHDFYETAKEYQLTRAQTHFNILHIAQKYIGLYSTLSGGH